MKIITDITLSYEHYLKLEQKLRAKRKELLLFCQHKPVITGGTQSKSEDIFQSPDELEAHGISFYKNKRGGSYVSHELGQCIIYPHIDLRKRGLGIGLLMEQLFQMTICSIEEIWNISCIDNACIDNKQAPGIYQAHTNAKIGFVALSFNKYFTSHGIALNIDNDLSTFQYINPCGLKNLELSSIQKEGADPKKLNSFIDSWKRKFLDFLG